jgi:hypothetical protein
MTVREAIAKKLKWWRKHDMSELYYPLDDIMQIIENEIIKNCACERKAKTFPVVKCANGHSIEGDNIWEYKGRKLCKTCRFSYAKVTRDIALFGGSREKIIQRDGEKCVRCGMTREHHRAEYGKDITVDHIDGKGTGVPRNEKNNDPSNLQTLCLRCHTSKDCLRRESVKGELHHNSKLISEDIRDIRKFYDMGFSSPQIARIFPVAESTIVRIARRETWRHVV